MIKKLLISLLLAFGLYSCAKIDLADPEPERIGFSWYTYSAGDATKAYTDYFVESGTTHLPAGKQFGVFGFFHPQAADGVTPGSWEDSNRNHPNLFFNQPVTVVNEGGTYSCTYPEADSRFWPRNTLDRISFIAYYPYNPALYNGGEHDPNAPVEPVLDDRNARNGMVGFWYTVPFEDSKQVDFMVSDLCMDQSKALWNNDATVGLTGAENGKVKFNFHHALSQVRVKSVDFVQGNNPDLELKINHISFKGVAVLGFCRPWADSTRTDAKGRTPVEIRWPVGNLSPRRPNNTPDVLAHVCYDEHDALIPENILLMIPHQFLPGSTITVNFDVERKLHDSQSDPNSNENYLYKNCELSATLTNYKLSGWEPGYIYNYKITLDLKKIEIDTEVEPWLTGGDDVILQEPD